jgi:ABC-type amino acid transport substrate-binding protein
LWVNGIFPDQQFFLETADIQQNVVVVGSLSKKPQDCEADSCEALASMADSFQAVANKQFLQSHPQIKRLLEVVEIPLETIDNYNTLLRENSTPQLRQKYAQEWITNNESRVQLWLAIATDEAMIAQTEQQMALSDNSAISQTPQSNDPNLAQPDSTEVLPPLTLPKLKVATKRFEPFVNYKANQYTGFSIDFWDAIAESLNIEYQLYGVDTVENLLGQVKNQNADIAIAGITITAEREQEVDFSHSYYESGLQILVLNRDSAFSQTLWGRILSVLFRPQLYGSIGIFLLILLIAAHIIWFTERQHNPEFPSSYALGIWESFWWAAVTVTTVGYGDKTPRRLPGRIFGLFWMCAGYFIFAYFTATVTTSFTIDELNAKIQNVEDLRDKNVATVTETTADQYLRQENINFIGYKTKEEAYLALKDREVDAVVYDAPALQYYAAHQGLGKVKVVGKLFELQDYGIALPLNSPYRKEINSALLKLIENGTYQAITNKWFGTDRQS